MKNQGFATWYIDAFAGTGDRHAELQRGGIFEDKPIEHVEEILDGSARKALGITPKFSHYVFVEVNSRRANVLQALMKEYTCDIQIRTAEANAELRKLFSSPPWSSISLGNRQRGVVFLDPYGMSVAWSTLQLLASTKRVDVWYLFPRKAVIQQLAHNIQRVDSAKRDKLSEVFGTADWEDELYRTQPAQISFLDPSVTDSKARLANPAQISAFAQRRLKTLFAYVSPPLPLVVNGCDFFELYCLSNNVAAIPLITRGVEHVIKKYTPASRRKFLP